MTIKSTAHFVREYKKHKSIKAVARAHDQVYETVRKNFYLKAVAEGKMDALRVGGKTRAQLKKAPVKHEDNEPVIQGRVQSIRTPSMPLPPKGQVRRMLFTCAQNNTYVNERAWDSVNRLMDHYRKDGKAEIVNSTFTYIKGLDGSDKANYGGKQSEGDRFGRQKWYDPRFSDITLNDRMEVAPGLVWCGENNTMPTAKRPLSGQDAYTGRKSAIMPHVKLALESIPADEEGDPTKFNYTTGTMTLRNYIQRKAGLTAEFHHIYGGLLAEVDHEGNWFCRQVNADSDGVIYDKDTRVQDGRVTHGHPLAGLTHGDPHVEIIDPTAYWLAFGPRGIKQGLRPEKEFMGDIWDFLGRAWQEMKDPHAMYRRHVQGQEDIRAGVVRVANFLRAIDTEWCETFSCFGNHEAKAGLWLKREDGRKDPVNAQFWIDMQKLTYEYIKASNDERDPNWLQAALHLVDPEVLDMATFLRLGQGHLICQDAAGGIQCGLHGHRGFSGKPGTPSQFIKIGRKMNSQHTHKAQIIDGVYVAGTYGPLIPGYAIGDPSSTSHSCTATYQNGKRAIYTFWANKWHAAMAPIEVPNLPF